MRLQQLMVAAIAVMFISQDAYALFCGKRCKRKKAKAKEHLANGGNCTDLRGGAKRKCKRQARKIARDTAKEQCASAGKKRRCRRKIRRDEKGRMGAYGFIGAKKANKQSKANWASYNQKKAELDQLLATGQISSNQHAQMLKIAEKQRLKESNRIGRVKTIKTVAAVGVAAATVATAGIAGVAAAGTTATGVASNVAVSAAGATTIYGSTGAAVLGTAGGALAATGGAAVAGGAALAAAGAGGSRKLGAANSAYYAKLNALKAANNPQAQHVAHAQPAYGRNPAASSPCKRLPVGSCQRKMCRCSVGVKRASQGLPILNHTNKNGGPSINKICAQHARLGPQGAWQALKNIRPNFVGRCH